MVYTAAAVELDDLVGELGDVFHAMGDHNQCGPNLLELLQKPPDVFASGGIEARHGFVEHEDGLPHRQDAGDRDAALLASREREGRRLKEGFGGLEVDGAQAVAHASVDLVRRHPEVARAKRDIVVDGLGKQLALGELRHVSNAATKLAAARKVGGVDARDAYRSPGGELEGASELGGGRLARSRAPNESGDGAGPRLEGEGVERERN